MAHAEINIPVNKPFDVDFQGGGIPLVNPAHLTQDKVTLGTAQTAGTYQVGVNYMQPFVLEFNINATEDTGFSDESITLWTAPFKCRILLAYLVTDTLTTANGDECQIKNGTTAITEGEWSLDSDDAAVGILNYGLTSGTSKLATDALTLAEDGTLKMDLTMDDAANHTVAFRIIVFLARVLDDNV